MTYVFTPNQPGLDRTLRTIDGAVGRWVGVKAKAVRDLAVSITPVKTGLMGNRTTSEVLLGPSGVYGRVIAAVPYAKFVHGGTKPHPIYPVNVRFLRFPVKGGGYVFARKVNHPGTSAQPWLLSALTTVMS